MAFASGHGLEFRRILGSQLLLRLFISVFLVGEIGAPGKMFIDPLGIARFVCLDQENTVWSQYGSCVTQEIILNHSILVVSFLGPRIREKQIQLIHFTWSEYFGDLLTEDFQQNHIVSPLPCRFLISTNESLEFEFDADTGSIRVIFCIIAEEISHTCADFEHEPGIFSFIEPPCPLGIPLIESERCSPFRVE